MYHLSTQLASKITTGWKKPVNESESSNNQVLHSHSSAGCLEVVGPAAVWFVWVPWHSDCMDWTLHSTCRWMLSSALAPWHCSTPRSTFSTTSNDQRCLCCDLSTSVVMKYDSRSLMALPLGQHVVFHWSTADGYSIHSAHPQLLCNSRPCYSATSKCPRRKASPDSTTDRNTSSPF